MELQPLYYVYMYRHPNGTPFYIGKGKGGRMFHRLNEAIHSTTNTLKLNIIRKILKSGQEPIIELVVSNLSEDVAFELEIFLISFIGRRDNGSGPLVNLTDGGEGSSGYIHREESKQKISKKLIGREVSQENRDRLSKLFIEENPMHNHEVLEKNSGENHWNFGGTAWNKGIPMTEEARKHLSDIMSGENSPNFGFENRRQAIIRGTTGIKKSNTENMKKPKSKNCYCENCDGWFSGGNYIRWHGIKCKSKLKDNIV